MNMVKNFSKNSAAVSGCSEQACLRVTTVSFAFWNLSGRCQDSRQTRDFCWLAPERGPGNARTQPQSPPEPRGAQVQKPYRARLWGRGF